jgi:hypothetical protein
MLHRSSSVFKVYKLDEAIRKTRDVEGGCDQALVVLGSSLSSKSSPPGPVAKLPDLQSSPGQR